MLADLALLFLRLGMTAFGGPAAHIAMMEAEIVRRRKWTTPERFLDLVSATNLIPGPNSTELAMHLGHERAGMRGLLVAGACFIIPAALVTTACAWAYVTYGSLPRFAGVLYGVKPVILAIVAQALLNLAPKAAKTLPLRVLGLLATIAVVAGVHELGVLLAAGILAMIIARPPSVTALFSAPPTLLGIFLFFAKVGAVLFGSGYVLLAFLRADLVERFHWLTEAELLDAIAVGQITPGPVFTTATFIGYRLAGAPGAAVATIGIFLPGFVLVAFSGPLIPRLRRSKTAGAFLDGVNVASFALMGVVGCQLARAAVVDVATGVLTVLGAALLLFRVNATWIVLVGAVAGTALKLL